MRFAAPAVTGPGSLIVTKYTVGLPSDDGVGSKRGCDRREVFAKRLDPFEALYRRGGLTSGQFKSAVRLFRDLCLSQGVQTDDPRELLALRRSAAYGPSDLINCRMIDAGARFEAALAAVGPATGEVLRALVAPAVMCSSVLVWRAVVKRVTGETHTHAQASVVRRACEDLRLAYDLTDCSRRSPRSIGAASEVA